MIANDGCVGVGRFDSIGYVCLLLIDRGRCLSNLFPESSADLLKFHTVNISTEVRTQVLIAFSDISMNVRFMVLSNILLYHKLLRDQRIIVFSMCNRLDFRAVFRKFSSNFIYYKLNYYEKCTCVSYNANTFLRCIQYIFFLSSIVRGHKGNVVAKGIQFRM